MKLVYFGTGPFALPALRALAASVVLVASQPDRPTGRGMKVLASPVKLLARELGLPISTPVKARDPDFIQELESLRPDAIVVASYGQILSQRLLDSAVRGGINLHGSILPCYRGAAPIQRSIQNGDTETGVTLMQMDKGMDTGNIIDIGRTAIEPEETYGELQDRLAVIAAELAAKWLPDIAAGNYHSTPQENGLATIAPKVDKSEAELDCNRSARSEYNRIRAFTPSPGAFLRTINGNLRVSMARLSLKIGTPGEVLAANPLTIAFVGGAIELLSVQPEGKKRMSGNDFANGARIKPGIRFV